MLSLADRQSLDPMQGFNHLSTFQIPVDPVLLFFIICAQSLLLCQDFCVLHFSSVSDATKSSECLQGNLCNKTYFLLPAAKRKQSNSFFIHQGPVNASLLIITKCN